MRQYLTQEQIENLEDLELTFDNGHVCLFPISQDWGRNVRWDARVYKKGMAGVLRPSVDSLVSIGCSREEAQGVLDRINYALGRLQALYPSMEASIEDKLQAIQSRVQQLEGTSETASSGS